jgi:hypothetical protein
MTKMFIEVQKGKTEAESRANFYEQLGCKVQPVVQQSDVTWINKMPLGGSEIASDTVDGAVWVVIATT